MYLINIYVLLGKVSCFLIERTGLKYEKIGELCGKTKQTICLYVTGKRNIPKLVIEKVQELDRLINGTRD